eukprot:GHVT01081120.1.p1 GENE.GHVT01081120.1~~GHVT01081120.1.p1  ORF type:complete len:268 (+),score=12.61 GHVT01081120.1:334-1137(+)
MRELTVRRTDAVGTEDEVGGLAGIEGEIDSTANRILHNNKSPGPPVGEDAVTPRGLSCVSPGQREAFKRPHTKSASLREPFEVEAAVNISEIGEIDTIAQTFFVNLQVTYTWRDPHAIGLHEGIDMTDVPNVYVPRIQALSAREFGVYHQEYTLENSERGQLVKTQHASGKLLFPIRLSDFPFDCEAPVVELRLMDPQKKAKFVHPRSGDYLLSPLSPHHVLSTEWQLAEASAEIFSDDIKGSQKSKIKIRIFLKRRWQFYLFKVGR